MYLENCVGFWAPQDQRHMELLKQVQQRVTQVAKGLEYLIYKRSLGELGLFSLEKKKLRRCLITTSNHLMRGAKEMEPDAYQWCPVRSQEAENSTTREEKTITLRSSNTGTVSHP